MDFFNQKKKKQPKIVIVKKMNHLSRPTIPASKLGPQGSPISLSIATSRTSGVAPLSVMFDAIGTTSPTASRPFHDLDYYWDFDDVHGYYDGGKRGPVVTHVFDQPGTYVVTCYARDSSNNLSTEEVTITVTDPDVVFAGTNTICVSGAGDFTGAPAGCTQVTTSVVNTALAGTSWYGKRVLFRRGETFTCTANLKIYNTTETIIGAFGTTGTVDARGIDDASPIFSILHDSTVFNLGDQNTQTTGNDLRICEIKTSYDNGGTSGHLVGLAYRATKFLHYRCTDTVGKPHNYNWSVGYGVPDTYGIDMIDDVCMANCYWNAARGYCVYASGYRMSFINSWFANTQLSGTHVMRIQFAKRHVVTGCNFGRSVTSTQSYTLRGRDAAVYLDAADAQYTVLTDNQTTGGTAWAWHIGSESTGHDETVRDVIVDGCSWDFTNHYATPAALHSAALDITVKNCWIGDIAVGITQVRFFDTDPYGLNALTPVGVTVSNNTFATNFTLSSAAILADADTDCEVTVVNNILYAPNAAAQTLTTGAGTFTSSNNLVNTDPLVTTSFTDLHLTVSSPAVGYGVITAQCLRDADDVLRISTNDAGVYQYV